MSSEQTDPANRNSESDAFAMKRDALRAVLVASIANGGEFDDITIAADLAAEARRLSPLTPAQTAP